MPSLNDAPLAARLRPETLDDFVGQQHLLGEGKPLRSLLEIGSLHSMILWGPSGTGKTTLAGIIARTANAEMQSLSAVLSGVKDVRSAVTHAQHRATQGITTVLFIDEVHRFNKAQQDAFLPHVENGTVVFIGATTENPSFEVNSALLSRVRVYVLKKLGEDDLTILVNRSIGKVFENLSITDEATQHLVSFADGDARRLFNLIEIASQLTESEITTELIDQIAGERVHSFDKGGDVYYQQISALHKSVRGSSPDAALYWFMRMLDGGCDPLFIARRVVRMASEDIGNADPRGLQIALAAWDTYQRLGSPEGELAIAQAVLYLASVPKSNAVYRAFNLAREHIAQTPSFDVPNHLRNAPTRLMKDLGYGKDYRYAHDEKESYAAGERYFPDGMQPKNYYQPQEAGLESKIKKRLARLRQLDEGKP